ncbi:MAG: hypothetical protein JKX73_08915 [Flavobacteriales bacterium]|nr:hypothetical protein [Flavobacteriales bacterium]
MTEQEEHIENLTEIRNLMERSTRFISLSGLSGVAAGLSALVGAAVAYRHFGYHAYFPDFYRYIFTEADLVRLDFLQFLFALSIGVLVSALGLGFLFTWRRTKRKGESMWNQSARLLLWHLAVPLVTGGLFCIILLLHGEVYLLAPTTLVFYGLALINASKYTLNDIQYLGISEIILGLIACVYVGYGLVFWALGFGILHIVYGTVMYFKYER